MLEAGGWRARIKVLGDGVPGKGSPPAPPPPPSTAASVSSCVGRGKEGGGQSDRGKSSLVSLPGRARSHLTLIPPRGSTSRTLTLGLRVQRRSFRDAVQPPEATTAVKNLTAPPPKQPLLHCPAGCIELRSRLSHFLPPALDVLCHSRFLPFDDESLRISFPSFFFSVVNI